MTPHFHSTPVPNLPEWPSQEEPGSGSTASAPVPGVSALVYTNGYDLLCGLWVWRRRTNCQPCCPPMSNPSTSSWSTLLTVLDDETTEWLLNTYPEI